MLKLIIYYLKVKSLSRNYIKPKPEAKTTPKTNSGKSDALRVITIVNTAAIILRATIEAITPIALTVPIIIPARKSRLLTEDNAPAEINNL
jgi:hypothetical protein